MSVAVHVGSVVVVVVMRWELSAASTDTLNIIASQLAVKVSEY